MLANAIRSFHITTDVCAQRAREEAAKAAELQYHAVVMERTEREFEVRV